MEIETKGCSIVKLVKKILLIISLICIFPMNSVKAEGKKNILILGSDAGYEVDRTDDYSGSRSDLIMILTLDDSAKSITISTIPRDSLVNIPGRGLDKVNHAFAYGGVDLTKQTLEEWLEIQFDQYFVVNMTQFVHIIDQINGVTVTPPTTFNWWNKFFFEKDVEQHLDGEHALAYSRERMTSGGDYARQFRMRQIVQTLLDEYREKDIEKYRDLFEEVKDKVITDASFEQILDYHQEYLSNETALIQFQLAGQGRNDSSLGYIDEISSDSLAELKLIVN